MAAEWLTLLRKPTLIHDFKVGSLINSSKGLVFYGILCGGYPSFCNFLVKSLCWLFEVIFEGERRARLGKGERGGEGITWRGYLRCALAII